MADLYTVAAAVDNAGATSVTIGANARKSQSPFSRFGTPELSLLKIAGATGAHTNSGNANSVFHRVVNAFQTRGEVYFSTTGTDLVFVLVNTNTLTNVDSKSGSVESGTGFDLIEAEINAITGLTVTISAATLS
jgi:hypothetical protein